MMTYLQKMQIGFVFPSFKTIFSNLRKRLTASTQYILQIIAGTDLFAENLSFNKNRNISANNLQSFLL